MKILYKNNKKFNDLKEMLISLYNKYSDQIAFILDVKIISHKSVLV